MSVWIFVIMMNLPSFGGSVQIEATFTSEEACERGLKALGRAVKMQVVEPCHTR